MKRLYFHCHRFEPDPAFKLPALRDASRRCIHCGLRQNRFRHWRWRRSHKDVQPRRGHRLKLWPLSQPFGLFLERLRGRPETCPPVCDTCRFYAFNGDESGAYIGEGRCEHPDHPKRCEPEDACPDFDCSVCGPARV